MKRAILSALLVVCALALPASANAGTITFTEPIDSYVNTLPSVKWTSTGPPQNTPICTLVITGTTVFNSLPCNNAGGPTFTGTNPIFNYTWNLSSYTTPEGEYSVTVNASFTDTPSTAVETKNFILDTTEPVVDITTVPPANGFTTSTPSIEFTLDEDNLGPNECSFDNFATAGVPCTSPFEATLADGPHSLLIRHTDAAGNQGFDSVAFVVDTTPPTINLLGLTNGTVVPTPYPQYSLETPGASSMQCFYDNNPSLTCQSISVSPTGLPDGAHTMHIIATDAAGNVATLVVSFTVDDSLAPPDQAPLPTGPRPTKVNLKKTKSVASGSKVKTTFSGSFTIRGGGVDWNNACTGRVTVKFTGKVNGKTKSYSKRASLKRKGSSCTFKGTASLPRAWKGKRVKTTVSHAGNAGIGKFAVSGGFRP